jgi:hypothetical protein
MLWIFEEVMAFEIKGCKKGRGMDHLRFQRVTPMHSHLNTRTPGSITQEDVMDSKRPRSSWCMVSDEPRMWCVTSFRRMHAEK